MALNRYEQMVYDYWSKQPDERRFWQAKVSRAGAEGVTPHQLSSELWRYFQERGQHTAPFREVLAREGKNRLSMLNLAEYLLRIWGPPPKPKPASGDSGVQP